MVTKTEQLKERIVELIQPLSVCTAQEFATSAEQEHYIIYEEPNEIAAEIIKAFNLWLEEQEGMHKVKCSHCSWGGFANGEAAGMSPCPVCNSTGYILIPLRLEVNDGTTTSD